MERTVTKSEELRLINPNILSDLPIMDVMCEESDNLSSRTTPRSLTLTTAGKVAPLMRYCIKEVVRCAIPAGHQMAQ